jgi:excisionase family DNA binding protein
MPNTQPNFFSLLSPAFLGNSLRLVRCSAFFFRTLGQRICEPHIAASDPLEQMTMKTESVQMPIALRPRDAAKALGISPRLLWQLTHDGHIPCVRVGSGKRRTVLYPTADLKAWLSRQTENAQGAGHDIP